MRFPGLINSAHFRFSRTRIDRGAAPNLINPNDIGVILNPLVKNFLDVSATNSFATGCGTCAPGHFKTNSYQVADDVDYVRGKHHIAFGGEYFKNQLDWLANTVSNGQFVFNGSLTGSPLSDFLLGRIFTVGKGAASRNLAESKYCECVCAGYMGGDTELSLLRLGCVGNRLLPESDHNGIGVRFDRRHLPQGPGARYLPMHLRDSSTSGTKEFRKPLPAETGIILRHAFGAAWHPSPIQLFVLPTGSSTRNQS